MGKYVTVETFNKAISDIQALEKAISGTQETLEKAIGGTQGTLEKAIGGTQETLETQIKNIQQKLEEINTNSKNNDSIHFIEKGDKFELNGNNNNDRLTYYLDHIIVVNGGNINVKNVNFIKDPNTKNPVGIIILSAGKENSFTDFNSIKGLESISYGSEQGVGNTMQNCDLINLGDNDKDINALTLVNLGEDNNLFENILVKNSGDDGIEIFNGSVNLHNITVEDAKDDFFDTDDGHSGYILGLNLIVNGNIKKSLIECGNSGGVTKTKFIDVNVYINSSKKSGDLLSYRDGSNDDYVFNFKDTTNCMINGKSVTKTNTLP